MDLQNYLVAKVKTIVFDLFLTFCGFVTTTLQLTSIEWLQYTFAIYLTNFYISFKCWLV